jgi:predicted nucleic acid-binding Zn ribbon protein
VPTYQTQCTKCGDAGDLRLSYADYDAVKSGASTLVCNSCAGSCAILFDPSSVQFVLKDGESGGWQSKAIKENRYRANHREVMARRA